MNVARRNNTKNHIDRTNDYLIETRCSKMKLPHNVKLFLFENTQRTSSITNLIGKSDCHDTSAMFVQVNYNKNNDTAFSYLSEQNKHMS